MSLYDESYPHPGSPEGKAWRQNCSVIGTPDPYTGLTSRAGTPAAISEVQHILAAIPGTVFWTADGGALVLTDSDRYVISVNPEGGTSSAYLVTVPAADVAAALDADEDEIAGLVYRVGLLAVAPLGERPRRRPKNLVPRSRAVSAKLSEEEYALVEAAAGAERLSVGAWAARAIWAYIALTSNAHAPFDPDAT